MNRIILSDTFLDSQESLSKNEKKSVRKILKKLESKKYKNSLSIHKLNRVICDESFRSVRVNRDLRLIVSEDDKGYILIYVDHHDSAYDWAENKKLETNSFGSMYMYDHFNLDEYEKNRGIESYQKGVLESKGYVIYDLEKLGISKIHSQYILEVYNEEVLIDFISFLPQEIQEALIDLYVGNKDLDEVYKILEDPTLDDENEFVNQKDSKRRFKVIEDISEYDIISKVYSEDHKWRIFLHPKQKFIVENHYNGTVLVEGGPGTGKTVVGMHRACYIAKNFLSKGSKPIYFFTFNRNLSESIKQNIKELYNLYGVAENKIQIINIDQFFLKNLSFPYYEKSKEMDVFKEVYREYPLKDKYSFDFIYKEYEMLIKIYGIISFEEYRKTNRKGMGIGLNIAQRKEIWTFFHKFLSIKFNNNIYNFEDRARKFYNVFRDKGNTIEAVIIDEVQDLSPIKLKAILSTVKKGCNRVFLLSDSNQRIYQLNTWKNTFNINIVGRTYYLCLNYRTTREIREYADIQFMFSKLEGEYLKEYKSIFSGPNPIIKDFSHKNYLYEYLLDKIYQWDSDIQRNEIGILCPSNYIYDLRDFFQNKRIKFRVGTDSSINSDIDHLNLTTIENCKGLEFKKTILINLFDLTVNLDLNDLDNWYEKLKLKRYESQKYVAITRAKEEIYILNIEE